MEMAGSATGINDGVTRYSWTSAKPDQGRQKGFFEVAFRTTRPCQMFELIETLGIDLVSDNDQSGMVPRRDGLSVPTSRAFEKKPRHRWHIGKLNGVCAKVFDPFSASMALVRRSPRQAHEFL